MEGIHFQKFLESTPPGIKTGVIDTERIFRGTNGYLSTPDLNLFCPSDACQGVRVFSYTDNHYDLLREGKYVYLNYQCRNCCNNYKVYSLRICEKNRDGSWMFLKLGEFPAFGPQTPTQTMKLIGGERDLFLKGRRCENQGMGIGAFVYYRRVLDNQRIRIFDELIRVISKISPGDTVISELEAAKNETQFTKAVEVIKNALPESLNINGYNPLNLLHSALSEGVHAHDDQGCLDLASSVRTVLFEFAEKLALALKEEAELSAAISRLANKNHLKNK